VAGRVGLAASKEVQAHRIAVIRALWFTECRVAAIGERLGISGTRVSVLAKRAGLPPRHEYNRPMPKPSAVPPERESRKPPQKAAPTPEPIAKVVTAKLKSPAGQPDKAELALRVVLPRAVLERLMARASRGSYPSLAAWVQAVLEREGKG
jgi:hypothetical protein